MASQHKKRKRQTSQSVTKTCLRLGGFNMLLNVYGVCDLPESEGKLFTIYSRKQFDSKEEAIKQAKNEYHDNLKIFVEEVITHVNNTK